MDVATTHSLDSGLTTLRSAVVSRSGGLAVTYGVDVLVYRLTIWDVQGQTELRRIEPVRAPMAVRFAPDETAILGAFLSREDHSAEVIRWLVDGSGDDGTVLYSESDVAGIAMSRDSQTVAFRGRMTGITVRDIATGLVTTIGPSSRFERIALSPRGTLIAATVQGQIAGYRYSPGLTGDSIVDQIPVISSTGPVQSMDCSENMIIAASGDSVSVVYGDNPGLIITVPETVRRIAISGSGSVLAVAYDSGVSLVHPVTKDVIAVIGTPSPAERLTFSLDDRILVTAHADNVARLWDLPPEPVLPEPGPAVAPLLAGYAADTVTGDDELGITADVDSLCSVLMASQVQPPLSVGLFGDWGSGKSFFMQQMRERIDWIAAESKACRDEGKQSDFCENVKQITFNAWHYVDANLWASLVTRIFDGLLGDTDDQLEPLTQDQRREQERRRRLLLAQLENAELLAGQARRQRYKAQQRLQDGLKERRDSAGKLDRLNRLRASDIRTAAQRHPEEVSQALDAVPPDLEKQLELLAQVHGTWSLLRGVWVKLGRRARWESAGLGLLAAGLIAAGILVTHGGAARAVPLAVAAASLLGVAARWLPPIRNLRRAVLVASGAVDEAVSREQVAVGAEIAATQAEIDTARRQLADADAEIAEIRDGHRLGEFVAARAGSTDYQRNLGFIAVVRRDLARLSRLLSEQPGDQEYQIDRIVLYVDDLDRCPAERVAQVLQAIHLLLAFPLFIVVVGADARWLLRSLELQYAELMTGDSKPAPDPDPEIALHWSATPQNYLDKIFQIPFSLKPMDSEGFDRLIRSTAVGPGSVPPPVARRAPAAGPGGVPGQQAGAAPGAAGSSAEAAQMQPAEDPAIEISLTGLAEAPTVSNGDIQGRAEALAFASEGRRLVVLSSDGNGAGSVVTTLDARTGDQRGSWATGSATTVLSADGSLIAVPSAPESSLSEADGGRFITAIPGAFSALYFSADGSWLTAVRPGGLTVFDPAGRQRWDRDIALPADLRWLAMLPGGVSAIAAGPDMVSAIALEPGGRQVRFDGQAGVLACSRDGSVLATADSDSVRIFDLRTGQRRYRVAMGNIDALAVSPDGSLIAAGLGQRAGDHAQAVPIASGGSQIVLIDAATAVPVIRAEFRNAAAIRQLAFSANGRMLAAVSSAGRCQVWSLASTTTNLRSERLKLTEPELEFLGRLAPLIRTPRAAKRLVNVYRILRAPLDEESLAALLGRDGAEPEHPAVLLLLTIVTGFPDPAQAVIGALLQSQQGTWADFIGKYRGSSADLSWETFFRRYDQMDQTGLPASIDGYVRWAPYAARYSFRTGRLLG